MIAGVIQSFSGAHVPYDNSVMESFFSNLKREELYRTKYRSEKKFRTAVDSYIRFTMKNVLAQRINTRESGSDIKYS